MATYIDDLIKGDTKVFQLDFGAGVDVTGWIVYLIIKDDLEGLNLVQISTTAGDDSDDDIANGLIHLTVGSGDLDNLEAGTSYYYAIKVNKGGSPNVIETIVPPVTDFKDKVKIMTEFEIN